jgi:hypothetical protein
LILLKRLYYQKLKKMNIALITNEKPLLPRGDKVPLWQPRRTAPVPIKPNSSLLLGFSISCLVGVALAKSINAFFDLGRLDPFVIAGVSICIFANGLRVVPTFHRGVIVLLGRRIPKFVLTEGCHWLLPMIYSVRPVPIKQEILELPEFRVTTNSDANDEFVEVRLQASMQWQVSDPGRFLENEKEAVEGLLKKWVIEAIRSAMIEDDYTYSTIVRTCGKSAAARALDSMRRKAESLGVALSDITIMQIKLSDARPGNIQAFPENGRREDQWQKFGLR